MAKKAGIRERIGTKNRLFHWAYCNRLVPLSRKNSPFHEAQLNLQLLCTLGAKKLYSFQEIGGLYGMTRLGPLPALISASLEPGKFNLILHPKSRGSAREWGLENFRALIGILPSDQYKIFITGTAAEGKLAESLIDEFPSMTDLSGKLTLAQLVSFISRADGLVAGSTGPLHIAAALGIHALGIYPPMRPIHPGRWAPIGQQAEVFVLEKDCSACRKSKDCACIRAIQPGQVKECLLQLPIPSTGAVAGTLK
jgi:ADP-heptose:LPS heptosyltransferase